MIELQEHVKRSRRPRASNSLMSQMARTTPGQMARTTPGSGSSWRASVVHSLFLTADTWPSHRTRRTPSQIIERPRNIAPNHLEERSVSSVPRSIQPFRQACAPAVPSISHSVIVSLHGPLIHRRMIPPDGRNRDPNERSSGRWHCWKVWRF